MKRIIMLFAEGIRTSTKNFIFRIDRPDESLRLYWIRCALIALSIYVLISVGLVAVAAMNMGGDTFMYHLPFSARMFGMIPADMYGFQKEIEQRYLGFPLLAERLQGLFWYITGRPQASDLVSYGSLLLLFLFLKKEMKIPLYLAVPALLAVPMIHMHASSSYIDLPSNAAVAILLLAIYLCYVEKNATANKARIAVIILAATAAANIKYQMLPIVCIALSFYALRFILDVLKPTTNKKALRTVCLIVTGILLTPLIFASEVKNYIYYGNPLYPLHIKVAALELKGPEELPNFMSPEVKAMSPYTRWGKSLLEIDAFDPRRPFHWTLGMDYIGLGDPRFGVGGYLAPYVVFQAGLFGFLCTKRRDMAAWLALCMMTILTVVTPLFPQAYELRYYMYWIIVLIAFNAWLICSWPDLKSRPKVFTTPVLFALATALIMLCVIVETRKYYTVPRIYALKTFIHNDMNQFLHNYAFVDNDAIASFKDSDRICLVGPGSATILYATFFHPGRHYYIKSEFTLDPKQVEIDCRGYKMVTVR